MYLGTIEYIEIYDFDIHSRGRKGKEAIKPEGIRIFFVNEHNKSLFLDDIRKRDYKVAKILNFNGYRIEDIEGFDKELAKLLLERMSIDKDE